MTDCEELDPPSPFIVEWGGRAIAHVPLPRRALDVAMGRGRHAAALARLGYRVFGVDANLDGVSSAMMRARAGRLAVHGWCADLTAAPLPRNRFELIVVSRYLQRDLFPALVDALVPNGVVLYETFTEAQRATGRGPRSPDHLLASGELRRAFDRLDVLFYEEVDEPDCVARLVAANVASRS
jgi:SAM-dependent methyltransferase